MTIMAVLDVISHMGADSRLFKRKDRHDLYGRSHMRNSLDEYDAGFSNEEYDEYEDDDMNNQPHHRHYTLILIALTIIVIGVLLAWLVLLPSSKLNNYPQTDGINPVVSIQIQKTRNHVSEYYVTINYLDANGHTQHISRLLQGDTLIVEGDTIQFPRSTMRFQLLEVTGQYKNVQSEPSISLPGNVIQPNDTDTGYLTTVQANGWMAPTVKINTCTVTLGPITNYNSHIFTIQVSSDGTCSKHQLS